jgi:hypothetical protein
MPEWLKEELKSPPKKRKTFWVSEIDEVFDAGRRLWRRNRASSVETKGNEQRRGTNGNRHISDVLGKSKQKNGRVC